ncbi:hypothetical protein Tter_0527 [Thermobaculum terrenum ATCC BAA-798]|uniref:Uncharacterized protein n=1 Tax=Thermobaculum terrenum (strain ATCC BAA-798 / CCMEE 7001 / YNP1) TaxID=525904 RepID=D1CET9_THET1|nr:hypothetical protein Tter_0527 [Thermobaculum terrenum ATCC BAA-798]
MQGHKPLFPISRFLSNREFGNFSPSPWRSAPAPPPPSGGLPQAGCLSWRVVSPPHSPVDLPPRSGEGVFVLWRGDLSRPLPWGTPGLGVWGIHGADSPHRSLCWITQGLGVLGIHERGLSTPLLCGSPRAGCVRDSWRGGGRESPPLLSMASPPPTKLHHSAIQGGRGEHMSALRCPALSQGPPLP